MVCRLGGPQTETVVMFAGENEARDARRFQRDGDGIGIESRRLKNVWILVAVTPFLICKCVHSEVKERRELNPVPGNLTLRWGGAVGLRRRSFSRRGSRHRRSQKSSPADH